MIENKLDLSPTRRFAPNFGAQISLLIALISLSFTAIFLKISLTEISINATLFNRVWLATLIFGMWSGFQQVTSPDTEIETEKSSGYTTRDIAFLIALGIVHISGRLTWTWSLTQTSVANSQFLGSLTPLFTTLGGWLLFKQYFDRRFIFGLTLAILGATCLGLQDSFNSNNSIIGDGAALMSSVFYAGNFLIAEQLSNLPVVKVLLWRSTIGTLVLLPMVLIFEEQMFPISVVGWIVIFCLAFICEALGHGLVVYCLKFFSAGFVSIFLCLDSVIVAILAWIIFAESLSLLNILSFGLIFGGVYLARTGRGSDKTTQETQSS